MLKQFQTEFTVETEGQGLIDITWEVVRAVANAEIATGIAHIFIRHTSASLLIQENADPDVQRDFAAFFRRLVPEGDPLFVHMSEGPDDMPAHVRAALTATNLSVPVGQGRPLLGTWQGIFLFEHRLAPHRRHVIVHVIGE